MAPRRDLDVVDRASGAVEQLDAFDVPVRGARVEVRLFGGARATGTVTAVDSHRCPHAPYSPLLWVEIEKGPRWAEGDEFSFYAHTVEAA